MKKIIGGGFISIIALVLFITVHNNAVNILETIDEWDPHLGRYLTAINETGGTTIMRWAIILLIISILIILIGCFEEVIIKIYKRKKQ